MLWRERGNKVNMRNIEYMCVCVNERQDNGSSTVKMQEEVAKMEDF